MIYLAFFLTSIIFLWNAYKFIHSPSKVHRLSSVVLVTASLAYLSMALSNYMDPSASIIKLRYMDWLITVPIMVYQMSFLSFREDRYTLIYPELTAICMLGTGYLGEIGIISKSLGGALGIILAISTFLPLFNQIDIRTNRIYYLTMIGWLFYPIVYFVADSDIIAYIYCAVDLTVKLGLSHYLYKKLV